MKTYFTLLISLLLSTCLFGQPAGYSYGKEITILASQVSGGSPLSNFPVLISFTDADLRQAPAGKVENANGYDIVFTLGDCFTLIPLDHQIESYNPATGEYVAWVKIPSLSNSVNTEIFMFYGNPGVATDPSSTAVWTSPGYDGVWHLHNDVIDASGNGNNGVNNGSTDVSPANNSGDGQNFVDPNHWIELPSHPNRSGSFSYSGWIKTNARGRSGQRVICDDATNSSRGHAISLGDPGSGRIRFYIRGLGGTSLDSPALITNNTWHYVAATYNASNGFKAIYIDGTLVASVTNVGSMNGATGNASIGGEVAAGETGNRFHGDLDEIRSFPGVLSPAWITTEYNNQNSPSSFYNVTLELTASELCSTLPIELLSFDAHLNGDKVDLKWVTSTEINNDFFTIERSVKTKDWEEVVIVNGAGNSNQQIEYFEIDYSPNSGTSYYRLKQTDFDGNYTYSSIVPVTVENDKNNGLNVFPNPVEMGCVVSLDFEDYEEEILVVLRDVTGKEFYSKLFLDIEKGKLIGVPIEDAIPAGIYLITATSENQIYSKKIIVK